MGCGASSADDPPLPRPMAQPGVPRVSTQSSKSKAPFGPLSREQYVARLTHSGSAQHVVVPLGHGASYTLQYAYCSQRGFYPDAPTKDNQDAFVALPSFGGAPADHLFGVFDGHGEKGTQCAQYAADKVPAALLSQPTLAFAPESALSSAFLEANRSLRASKVDDSLSGTTAITMLVRGASLCVSNVGDSRACLAEDTGRALAAINLSCDQTPFRRDECARVRKAGARVMTLDQIEGLKDHRVDCWGTEEDDDGDPPRLWVPNGMYPGTAFTRSIGDAVAERIGVYAQPEVDTFPLTPASRFAVVASDGVFEFLPSQAVVDMVAKFEDPLEACLAIVAESYRLWLQYETRTDDITIIIVKFLDLAPALEAVAAAEAAALLPKSAPSAGVSTVGPLPVSSSRPASIAAGVRPGSAARPGSAGLRPGSAGLRRPGSRQGGLLEANDPNDPGRPVRRSMVRAKREAITASLAATAEEDVGAAGEAEAPVPPKTPAEAAALAAAVTSCFLFAHLTDAARAALVARFVRRPAAAGEWVCSLGERAEHFFVVDEGEFDVHLCAPGDATDATVVHSYAVTKGVRPSFGELALLYNQPRTASVRARGDGALWALSRAAFRASAKRTDTRELLRTLRSVEVLKSLSPGQLQRLADCLSEVAFQDGDVIIRQGDEGDAFFIIVTGSVACSAAADGKAKAVEFSRLGPSQTFGERALLSADSHRTATVTAVGGAVTCLRVSRATFEEVLGPLAHIIDADRRWRERAAAHRTAAAALPSVGALRALTAADLGTPRPLWTCDVGRIALAPLRAGAPGDAVTLRQVAIGAAAAKGRQASVMRERELAGLIAPMPFIPALLKSFSDDTWLTAVLSTSAACSVAGALSAPLAEAAAGFYVAEAAMALEHIHWHGVLFRGLSPDTALLDADGHLQLCDFRFAKQLAGAGGSGGVEGRTFTLCGHPEYLAPEVVKGTGHSEAADWWALGCFAWWLLTHHTPFAGPDEPHGEDNNLQVYKRIAAGGHACPPGFSEPLRALLAALLATEPDARGGAAAVRDAPWLAPGGPAAVDWDRLCAVMTDEVPAPAEATALLKAALAAPVPVDDMQGVEPYTGDKAWFADF